MPLKLASELLGRRAGPGRESMSHPLSLDVEIAGASLEEEPVTPQPESSGIDIQASEDDDGDFLGYSARGPSDSETSLHSSEESTFSLTPVWEEEEVLEGRDREELPVEKEELDLGNNERPIPFERKKGFYPVYHVLVTNHPLSRRELLNLEPALKVDDLGDPADAEAQSVQEFIDNVYRRGKILKVAAYAAGCLAVYSLTNALDDDPHTRLFKRDFLSGTLLGPNHVVTNTHGVRFDGSGRVGSERRSITFVQVAKAAEFLAGPSCYKLHFDQPEYPRYVLQIPQVIKDTDTVRAARAAVENPRKAKKLNDEVDFAIHNYAQGPASKGPITDEQLFTSESLDPDIVALDITMELKEMPVPLTNYTRCVTPMPQKPSIFAVPALWFDPSSNRSLATSETPFISLYMVGSPPSANTLSAEKLEDACGDYILRSYKQAKLKAEAKLEAEAPEDGEVADENAEDSKTDPELEFFQEVKKQTLAELEHNLQQTFTGLGLAVSVGHVARFDVEWDEKKERPESRRLVINDEDIGHTLCSIPGNSASPLFDPKLPPGCAVGLHSGPAAAPHPNKPLTRRMPWGTVKELDNLRVRPPWNNAVAFSGARAYDVLTRATLKGMPAPDDPYWLRKESLGSHQLLPYTRYHEFHLYSLACMPAAFLEDTAVQAWVKHVVEKRSLCDYQLNRMALTPSVEELNYLLSKEKLKVQLGKILSVHCESHQLSRELSERLRGPNRHTNRGVICDYMTAHPEEHFDLSDWPFPFLKLRSWDDLKWLVGRLRKRDSCNNYIPENKLAKMMPPEKAPDPDRNEKGTPGYKELFPFVIPKAPKGGKSDEGGASSKSAESLEVKS